MLVSSQKVGNSLFPILRIFFNIIEDSLNMSFRKKDFDIILLIPLFFSFNVISLFASGEIFW